MTDPGAENKTGRRSNLHCPLGSAALDSREPGSSTPERVAGWCEKLIFALILAILFIGPLAFGAARPREFLVLQGLTLAAASVWLVRLWMGGTIRLLWSPVCWAVLGFMTYAVVRYRLTLLEYVAREELIRVLVYGLLFLLILNLLAREQFVSVMGYSLVLLAAGIGLYAAYQFLSGSTWIWHLPQPAQYRGRASGTYVCPNHLAGFLEMILPLGLACLFTGRLGRGQRLPVGGASLLILAGIGATLSRGGWLATGLSLVVFFSLLARHPEFRFRALIGLLILLAGGVVFVGLSKLARERIAQTVVAGQIQDIRLQLWRPAWQMWREAPWLGVGPGHFNYRFNVYRPESVQEQPDRVHNDYLNTLTDWGLVGFGIFAAGWGLLALRAVKTWKQTFGACDPPPNRSNQSAFRLGAAIGLLALLVHSAVDFNLQIPANAIVAVCLAALVTSEGAPQTVAGASCPRRDRQDARAPHWNWLQQVSKLKSSRCLQYATGTYWIECRVSHRLVLSLAILGAMAFIGPQGWRRWQEFAPLAEARLAEVRSRLAQASLKQLDSASPEYASARRQVDELDAQALAALKQAHAIEPMNFETTYRIGEALRTMSWEGRPGYEAMALEAMPWFRQGMRLNPWDAYNYLGYGLCLHWVRRYQETQPYFDKALALDPNGYYTAAQIGWHLLNLSRPAEAKPWFARSLRLKPHKGGDDNPLAAYYLDTINQRPTADGLRH